MIEYLVIERIKRIQQFACRQDPTGLSLDRHSPLLAFARIRAKGHLPNVGARAPQACFNNRTRLAVSHSFIVLSALAVANKVLVRTKRYLVDPIIDDLRSQTSSFAESHSFTV